MGIQMNSDLARQNEFMQASLSAKREGAVMSKSPLYERLATMQAREERRRNRRFPWLTIVIALIALPFIMQEKSNASIDVDANIPFPTREEVYGSDTPETEVSTMMIDQKDHEKATVSVTIGGKTVSKEMSVSDIRKMHMSE